MLDFWMLLPRLSGTSETFNFGGGSNPSVIWQVWCLRFGTFWDHDAIQGRRLFKTDIVYFLIVGPRVKVFRHHALKDWFSLLVYRCSRLNLDVWGSRIGFGMRSIEKTNVAQMSGLLISGITLGVFCWPWNQF